MLFKYWGIFLCTNISLLKYVMFSKLSLKPNLWGSSVFWPYVLLFVNVKWILYFILRICITIELLTSNDFEKALSKFIG